MKLTVSKLGRIGVDAPVELDIRPLTVFIGENGTQKTWVAYALFAALRCLSRDIGRVKYLPPSGLEPPLGLDALGALFRKSDSVTSTRIDLDHPPSLEVEVQPAIVAGVLGASTDAIGADARVDFTYSAADFPRAAKSAILRVDSKAKKVGVQVFGAAGPLGDWTYVGELDSTIGEVQRTLASMMDTTALLPAERLALTMPGLVDVRDRGAATPAAYLEFGDTLRAAHIARTPGPLKSLASALDSELGGAVVMQGEGGLRSMRFAVADGPVLPLHLAASAVRSVAGLTQFLHWIAQPGDAVVIDELEMNAHPKLQLALAELVACMVNAGIRVVFTTHSPYIVDHLSNLMVAGQASKAKQDELAKEFALGTTDAFLDQEKVAAWWFKESDDGRQVVPESVVDRERGLIRWQTFSEQTERLGRLFSKALVARGRHRAANPRAGKSRPKAKR